VAINWPQGSRIDLSEGGTLLVIECFALVPDAIAGFEVFCALYVLSTDGKYGLAYEAIAKRIKDGRFAIA
jgi:hypothetical protein